MTQDTNFYLIALEEFRKANPLKKRCSDVDLSDLSGILRRAQVIKDADSQITIEERIAATHATADRILNSIDRLLESKTRP